MYRLCTPAGDFSHTSPLLSSNSSTSSFRFRCAWPWPTSTINFAAELLSSTRYTSQLPFLSSSLTSRRDGISFQPRRADKPAGCLYFNTYLILSIRLNFSLSPPHPHHQTKWLRKSAPPARPSGSRMLPFCPPSTRTRPSQSRQRLLFPLRSTSCTFSLLGHGHFNMLIRDAPRSVWITMSSSVILFNKWVLDTLQFRMLNRIVVTRGAITTD